ELNVPILALSQLSRATETRGGSHRPQLSDLRESGAIEQDADIVAFIHRPEYYGINLDENGMPTAGLAEIILAKHRNGAVCDVKLRFLKDQARFADMDADEYSTAADPTGGQRKYNYVQSNMPAPEEAGAPMGGGLGGGLGSGLGSAMGGGEFDLNQGPTNIDRQAPLTDEVPF
ncbi:MAG: DnaB-like helicase C-terminal domain-containing protein, partial [Tidjanibacter sp.]|nr:DnaB-like helicase C-terminal domain-containing protein [Tidjanibacter sp.]